MKTPRISPLEEVMSLLGDNKDMKKMFKDMEKLQKDVEALKKLAASFKIKY
ncbi:hypothetical protein [Paenibacillus mucilaginosus]|uniref:Uncharacterized protein n=3 Tax=Paenibacillus mucilaginosus TaxID=61624 RepID=H6N9H7_9BACL|nr:hypothetical protein [Paenibacillus mucilaginosus]AEI42183.1 hypothetical protein KNP414_03639 [Paenibacillus mucilaginosus KNP414]AFC27983.1 hypothetical protein PM3016_1046 [Paenibacillus mucilaginosus 3016]AFH60140.1 hypothetical protein B2K_05275 [Paenibacillus mucilaginosus K02]MCG7214154.1 hypothetical protein [Paenibacillus mucilaginosus]WDM28673.1 hypothetical protein KCX80_05480 [Paenibacillus mucilaginosus]